MSGFLEVGVDDNDEVVVNHPDLMLDAKGVGHIVFSPDQARGLASLLVKHAAMADTSAREKQLRARREAAAAIPVDRSARVLSDGRQVTDDHAEIESATGQQKGYVVLTAGERSKGFVRPVRTTYTHLACGTDTIMGLSIAETYARDPKFYSGTFCVQCRTHLPLMEFVWKGTQEQVGS